MILLKLLKYETNRKTSLIPCTYPSNFNSFNKNINMLSKTARLADIRAKIQLVKNDMNKPSHRHFRHPRKILAILTLIEIELDPPII